MKLEQQCWPWLPFKTSFQSELLQGQVDSMFLKGALVESRSWGRWVIIPTCSWFMRSLGCRAHFGHPLGVKFLPGYINLPGRNSCFSLGQEIWSLSLTCRTVAFMSQWQSFSWSTAELCSIAECVSASSGFQPCYLTYGVHQGVASSDNSFTFPWNEAEH